MVHTLRFVFGRPATAVSAGVILLFAAVAVVGPWISPYDPGHQDYSAIFGSPSGAHLLGTDDLGRDVLSRLIEGARISLAVALATTALVLVVAVPIGLVAGYYRGWLDVVVSRGVDVMLAFPYIILAVGLAVIMGPSLLTVTVSMAVAVLPWLIRIVRGEVLSLREREYVSGAVLDGARTHTILFRHLLPNLTGPLIVQATLLIPFGILGEALLSFLGLGVQPPTATWGVMLANAQPFAQSNPGLSIVPGIAIAVVTLAFNLLGDGLRDLFDPRTVR
ncbi:ABC transporter permease [Phytoactinopolyspora endophytica]|uniref:ABC transporter permease n=1 Tax=Phytoactinopolyspora endophytica TaxID=1642495 RepID=UPI00197C1E7C|nr:ABC transporter permease [Phytoactinopolyspora endophytica]